jgi:hypothetical protein
MSRFERPGDDLQQRGFAAAVWADYARGGSCLDFEANITQGPEFPVPLPAASRK